MSDLKTGIGFTEENLRKVLQKFNEDLGTYVNNEERFKLGQILTIIDASFADTEQRKAVKDLVNNSWWGGTLTNRAVQNDGMGNPHSALRAICELFGFDLYPENADQLTAPAGENLDWLKKKYEKHDSN